MENILDYIKPELLVLIPVLYLLGLALKKSSVKDSNIPWILGAAGVALSVIWIAATSVFDGAQQIFLAVFTAITQGVLCAGASVYINQLYKQSKK